MSAGLCLRTSSDGYTFLRLYSIGRTRTASITKQLLKRCSIVHTLSVRVRVLVCSRMEWKDVYACVARVCVWSCVINKCDVNKPMFSLFNQPSGIRVVTGD